MEESLNLNKLAARTFATFFFTQQENNLTLNVKTSRLGTISPV